MLASQLRSAALRPRDLHNAPTPRLRAAVSQHAASMDADSARKRLRAEFAYFDAEDGRGDGASAAGGARPAFMENAGGSQVPRCVADAVRRHMLYDSAQLGAGHVVSQRSTAVVAAAHDAMAAFMGCTPPPPVGGAYAGAPAAAAAGVPPAPPPGAGHVALGPSASQLLANLAYCYAQLLGPGDEVVVQESCHEANAGPWVRCAEQSGATLRWWRTDLTPAFAAPAADGPPAAAKGAAAANGGAAGLQELKVSFPCASSLAALRGLLSPRTRVVAVTHVSNLLGGVADLRRVVALVREAAPNARLVVDGVAYAPHRLVDVATWGVDWYALSIYKVWGPHAAALYGAAPAWAELTSGCRRGPNHYFVGPFDPVYWFELGGFSHEAAAGVVALGDYLRLLAVVGRGDGESAAGGMEVVKGSKAAAAAGGGKGGCVEQRSLGERVVARADVVGAMGAAERLEAGLADPILALLQGHPRVILIGPGALEGAGGSSETAGSGGAGAGSEGDGGEGSWAGRVPTISFVHTHKLSRDVAAEVQARGYAIRSGHAYAHRLMTALAPALAPYLRRGDSGSSNSSGAAGAAGGAAGADGSSSAGAHGRGGGAAAGDTLAGLVEDGVVRISLLHYNTPAEVAGLVAALHEVLC